MSHSRPDAPSRRRGARGAIATIATSALVAGAVAFTPLAASAATEGTITDAVFEWGLSNEAGGGAFFGGCNFLSAGIAGNTGSSRLWTEGDGFYKTADGNVSILKDGPEGAKITPTWSTKCQTGAGGNVTSGNTASTSGNIVRIADGAGSVAADGSFEIEWDGDFSVVFYGGLTYWSASDPVLTVGADGVGQITATASGYGTSMEDQSQWVAIEPREIVLADLTDVEADDTGFTATPAYLGVETTSAVGTPQVRSGATWGSFPQSYVTFQDLTGQHSYWYSSGGSRDAAKPATPVTVSYEIVAPAATATSVAVSPATRVVAGADVTLTASVSNTEDAAVVPTGTVQFYSTAAGTAAATPVGAPVELSAGAASLTTSALAGGGHAFTAVFTPRGAFAASSSAPSANLGVVDASAPVAYEPGPGAVVSDTAATASWNWSVYGDNAQPAPWAKVAGGDITVAGRTFELSDGVVTADAGGAVVDFTGTIRVAAYAGISGHGADGAWIELVDPSLHLKADGSGVWVAGVHSGQHLVAAGTGAYAPKPDAERLVVTSFSGVSAAPGDAVDTDIAFDFAGSTAQGTWSAAFDAAWSNQFILAVPAAIQAFYYQTGATASQLTKAASPLSVTFDWPRALTAPVPTLSGTAKVGSTLTAVAGSWTTGATLAYQWLRAGAPIAGATSATYTAVAADSGTSLSVRVTGALAGYVTTSKTSAAVTVAAGTLVSKTPVVSGSAKVGVRLSVSAGAWTPGARLAYQWLRDGVAIKGASAVSYVPVAADAGRVVSVRVTGSLAGYATVSQVSAGKKVAAGSLVSKTPVVSGTVKVGAKVSAKAGAWSAGARLSYQWLRNGAVIKGATTSTYVPVAADRGRKLSVRVTGSLAGYVTVVKSSAAKTVAYGTLKAPAPKITGSAKAGKKLSAVKGTWTAGTKVTYQWYVGGKAVKGATKSTYTVRSADRGKTVVVKTKGVKSGYKTVVKTSASKRIAR